MDEYLIENFIYAMLRFKKMTSGLPCRDNIPMLELTILERVTAEYDRPCQNLNIAEIQETLCVSKPAVSQTLNTLERKGYVRREIHPQDRRRVSIAATQQGRQALEQSRTAFDHTMIEVLNRFGKEDMTALVNYLNRLSDVYEQLRQEL